MKFSYQILFTLQEQLNIENILNVVTGKIYIGGIPKGDQNTNITLNTLVNKPGYMQSGYINLNIYAKQVVAGRPDIETFNKILNVISPLINNVKIDSYTFDIDDDKGWFEDKDNDGLFFYNLKLKFHTT